MTALADVSVIIPAWRAADTIGRALSSIRGQTVLPRQVVVVDDGSDDGTFEAAEAWRDRMVPVELTVLRQPNSGAGAARNRALQAAEGTYVACLDADDQWLPAKIERSMLHLEGTNLVLASHDFLAETPAGDWVYADCCRHFRAAADPFAALFVRAYVATTTVVARRDAIIAAGGFDASLRAAQDYELWLAMLSRPDADFVVFPEALTRYHYSAAGITSNVERRRQCSLVVLRRHAASLRGRGWRGLAAVFKRALVIHYEAMGAHLARHRPVAGSWAAIRAVPALAGALAAFLAIPARPRLFTPPQDPV